ncbi:MAG: hypothetical protein HRT54_01585 [Colwellia sp.]|nr:hypothetical protein [Colwellia sp.]
MSERSHPEHIRSLASMPPRHTVHPEHIRSLASMPPRHTVHPEHIFYICPSTCAG